MKKIVLLFAALALLGAGVLWAGRFAPPVAEVQPEPNWEEILPLDDSISFFEDTPERDAILEWLAQFDDPELQDILKDIHQRIADYENGTYTPPTAEEEAAAEVERQMKIQRLLEEAEEKYPGANFGLTYSMDTGEYTVDVLEEDYTPIEAQIPEGMEIEEPSPSFYHMK